jgi:hypothetical protein
LKAALQVHEHAGNAEAAGIGDRVFERQGERSEHRRVRRQHRRGELRAEPLPGDCLILPRVGFISPGNHPEEIEPHVPVRVDVLAREPWVGALDVDAELLVQLARQGLLRRLAGFDLAARELPIARVYLARGALRQQERAVRALQHRGGHLHHYFPFACRPAQSLANW